MKINDDPESGSSPQVQIKKIATFDQPLGRSP